MLRTISVHEFPQIVVPPSFERDFRRKIDEHGNTHQTRRQQNGFLSQAKLEDRSTSTVVRRQQNSLFSMWRVGCLIRSEQRRVPGRLLMAQWYDGGNSINSMAGARFFARRPGGDLGDDDEELRVMKDVDAGNKRAKEMESYGTLIDDDSDDEDDEGALADEEYRLKQKEIQRELDSRTGRVWNDPWEIAEEQWMSTATFNDLPEWSPEFVSRISQERVQIHPGRCLKVHYIMISRKKISASQF
jgi:hypothetical protein